jgi:WD40 repeat protein
MLASASADATMKLWTLDSPIQVLPHGNRVYKVAFRPKDSILASGSFNTIRLWGQDGTPISSVMAHNGGAVTGLSFSPDKGLMASAGTDLNRVGQLVSTIKLWRLGGSQILPATKVPTALVKLDATVITDIQFVPHQALLASVGQDGIIRFWRYLSSKNGVLDQGELVYSMVQPGQISSLIFSHDGTRMLTTSKAIQDRNGVVKLWQVDFVKSQNLVVPSLTLLKTIERHQGDVLDASFSPDDQQFATVGTDRAIRLWRRDGVLLKTLPVEHTKTITTVRFSPDGKLLASASQDGHIKLWTREGSLITTLNRHRREVASLSFSADSQILASASYDNQVLLWKLPDRFDQNARIELLKQGCQIADNYLKQNPQAVVEVQRFCQRKQFRPIEPESPDLDSRREPNLLEAMQRGN